MDLYDRINDLCRAKKISRHKLELACDLSNGSINTWKNHAPRASSLKRVAEYFGVSVSYLTGGEPSSKRIPVYASIPAGIPLEAISTVIDYEEIPDELAIQGEYFGVCVKGDSMEPELRNGDVLIVKSQQDAESGDIVVAGINGNEACVKKLIKADENAILQPLNPAYQPIICNDLTIYGKVVEVRRRF